ncbi:Polyadenylate-binding protein, cytoplasmic and nuclear [Cercospora beticola]|uniref:Polyadenylate-binding protein, cytoplasmic and nuclear n=1 Tax=Cercospora beticola TaxID=122368 RepID=A0A2G5I770_CERBT|nr:Polyadenylate-binding protein, cytoplasmic and nuclear [Cercospora beticola]PIB00647.1 Polyadenylate-binding protein, cytoplasmic and nuclear [Cercospora beticola]WPA95865.1 hypothetical protein RHO25_000469 [Cercospora beticola]CAK1355877.1 unnamed protein product [Cercospora beticola]
MFALRRVAARALQCQPTRQLSSVRCTPLSTRIEASKPSLIRSFHQSQRWLADEEEKKADVSAAEQSEIKETDEDTRKLAPAEDGVQEVSQEVKNATAAAKDAISSAAETVTSTVASVGRATGDQFPGDRSVKPGQSGKILYVGNLFFEVRAQDLEREFAQYGQVVNSRVVTDQTGRSKGFGYIEFSTSEEADKAIRELDQKTFQGRRMAVQHHVRRESRNPREPRNDRNNRNDRGDRSTVRQEHRENPPSKTLFIGNMSYQMSDRDLNDLFREIKNVLDVRVAIDRRSGQPRGFAHADFIDVASAEKAKAYLSSKVVYGRELRVNFSLPSSKTEQS